MKTTLCDLVKESSRDFNPQTPLIQCPLRGTTPNPCQLPGKDFTNKC